MSNAHGILMLIHGILSTILAVVYAGLYIKYNKPVNKATPEENRMLGSKFLCACLLAINAIIAFSVAYLKLT